MVVFQAHGGELRKGHAAVFERGQQRRVLVFTQDIAAGIYDEAGREPGRDQRGDVAQLLPLIFFDILSSSARRILEHMPAEAEYHLFCGEHVHIVHAAVEYGRAELKGRAHAELLLNVGLVADAGERRGIVGASAVARDDNARKIEPVFLRILRNEVERRGYLPVLRGKFAFGRKAVVYVHNGVAQSCKPARKGAAVELVARLEPASVQIEYDGQLCKISFAFVFIPGTVPEARPVYIELTDFGIGIAVDYIRKDIKFYAHEPCTAPPVLAGLIQKVDRPEKQIVEAHIPSHL